MTTAQEAFDALTDIISAGCMTRDGLTAHGSHLYHHAENAIKTVLLRPKEEQTAAAFEAAYNADFEGCVCGD